MDDPARLVPGQGPIGVELVLEQPLARNGTGQLGNQAPGVVGDESIVFRHHRRTHLGSTRALR
jgi:hypothetical protein